jgi:hypothetical protein
LLMYSVHATLEALLSLEDLRPVKVFELISPCDFLFLFCFFEGMRMWVLDLSSSKLKAFVCEKCQNKVRRQWMESDFNQMC